MTYGGIIAAVALALAASTGCHPPRPAPTASAAPRADTIRVLTWNVLKEKNLSYGATCETIARAGAPIVMLQEVTKDMASELGPCLESEGFSFHWCGDRPTAGATDRYPWYPAIAAKFEPIDAPDCAVHLDESLPNGFVTATVPTDGGTVRIVNAHLAPDNWNPANLLAHASDRVRQVQNLLRKLATLAPLPTIIAGDFNEPARGGAVTLLTSHYREATEAFPGLRDRPTWNYCWPNGFGPLASHIDFVFYDASFVVADADLLPHGPSDHRPLLVTLRRPPSHRPCASR